MKNLTRIASHLVLQCLAVLFTMTIALQVRGQNLVEFDASALSGVAAQIPVASVDPNLSSTAITRHLVTGVSASAAYCSSNWPVSPALAPTGTKYIGFTLTPSAGNVLNLNGAVFTFSLKRTSTGPANAYIYTSVDGFSSSANALNNINPIVTSGATNVIYTFPAGGYNNLLSITIRIYADHATSSSTGTLSLMNPASGNIRISGGTITSCVPVISSISSNTPVCFGSTLDLTSGATANINPITYSWAGPNSFSAGTQNASIPAATSAATGTYTMTATNACGSSQSTTFATVGTQINADISSTNETCNNGDGTATVVPSGGAGGYSYSWNPTGQTTAIATGLSAGNYTCTVTDANGCNNTGSVTVSSTACGGTRLMNSYCGSTLTALNQPVYCVTIPNATNYQYQFMQGSTFIATYVRGNYLNNCDVSNIPNLQYGQTYDVTVRSLVGNVWSTYGTSCTLTLPPFPSSHVGNSYCGLPLASFSSPIYCAAVIGATNYEWKFMQGATVVATYQRGNYLTDCVAANVAGLQYSQAYDVSVRAFEGGVWGPFGASCQIFTPESPLTHVSSNWCDGSVSNLSTGISCDPVQGATNYQWKVESGAYSSTMNRGNNSTNWRLSWNAGTTTNTTYTVSVRAFVGGSWQTFGTPCTISVGPYLMPQNHGDEIVPPEVRMANPENVSVSTLALNVYPNPFAENITLTTDPSVLTVSIFNSFGDLVRIEKINGGTAELNLGDLAPGIYLIEARTETGVATQRIVKQ